MSTTDLNVQSGLWQALMLYDSECGWTVQELIDICHDPHHDKAVAAYFQPGSGSKLRNFITKRPQYFKFDPSTDRVSLPEHSLSTVLEECLIEFMALQIKASSGLLDLKCVKFEDYNHILPGNMIDHMQTIYAGSLQLFFKTHITSFVLHNENRVKLASKFESTSILADPDNLRPVSFFLGLLQKIGASKEKPCFIHTLTKYLHYMDADAREFLKREYHNNLNLFFLLNRRHFRTTKPEKGSAFLRAQPAVDYSVVAYLQQLLQKKNAFTYSAGLTFQSLLSRGANWWLPLAQSLLGSADGLSQLKLLLATYPNIFRWQPTGKVCLRKKYTPWKEEWNSGLELLTVLYFTDVLKGIGSASPSNPICFNYIALCAESAPPECKDFLDNVFPGLDIINLFHLHSDLFDFSSTNCVSLKCPPAESKSHKTGSPEKLSARYAAQLLKYASKLTPDLLAICVETAPPAVRTYCKATVKDRLHSVIESGLKLLQNNKNGRNTVIDDIRNLYQDSTRTVLGEQVKAAEQETNLITGDAQTGDKAPVPRHSRRHLKTEPKNTEEKTDNGCIKEKLLPEHVTALSAADMQTGAKALVSVPTDQRRHLKAEQEDTEEEIDNGMTQQLLTEQVTALSTADVQTGAKAPIPVPADPRRYLKAEPGDREEETDNSVTEQLHSEHEELLPSSRNQVPGRTSPSSKDCVLEYITKRLQEAPAHAENIVDLVAAVNRDVGPMSDYEILLSVLANEEALGFDGKQIYNKPKP